MTALTAMQTAAVRLIGRRPTTFFSSTATFEVEMVNLLNEVARDITLTADWQGLTKIHTFTGDGTTAAFNKPDDYDRMLQGQSMSDGDSWFWNYTKVPDLDMWIAIQNGFYLGATPPGWWILFGDQFQFAPPPPASATAMFPYISNLIARDTNGNPKQEFTTDSDTFVLDERLLTLALIWRWREMKLLDYAADQANFEKAFDQAATRDRGSRVIRKGALVFGNVPIAWPWALGGP